MGSKPMSSMSQARRRLKPKRPLVVAAALFVCSLNCLSVHSQGYESPDKSEKRTVKPEQSPDSVQNASSPPSTQATSTKKEKIASAVRSIKPLVPPDFLDEPIIPNNKNIASLSDGALKLAKILGILDDIDSLQKLRNAPKEFDSLRGLHLRQDVTEALLEAFFDVNGAIAAIDDEVDHTQRLQDEMSDSRDRAIRYNNIANFTSTGTLSILNGSFQLRPQQRFQNPADIFSITAGGIATGLSAYALKQQSGGRRSALRNPNMLAQVLGRPVLVNLELPDTVWEFLSDSPPGTTKSRRDLLIEKWVEAKLIASPTSKEGQKDIDTLSNSIDINKGVTIDMLNKRAIMLSELKETLEQMSRDIQVIMRIYRHPR